MRSSPVISLNAESNILPLAIKRKEMLCRQYHNIMTLPPMHPITTLFTNSGIDMNSPSWLPGTRQPLFVRALQAYNSLNLTPPPPQPTSPHSPVPPWRDLSNRVGLHIPDFPSKQTGSTIAAALFLQLEGMKYHHHTKIFTDGSHSPSPKSTAAAIYDPGTTICRTWKLPPETDIVTAELYAIHQALTHLHITHRMNKSVIYTDSLSSLYLILSRRPASATNLVHSIQQTLLLLTMQGWEVTLQWVPSHSGIRGNEVVDAAAKMALSEHNTTPLPLPLSTARRLIAHTCHTIWDDSLRHALRGTSMGQYRSDSSPQPWVRQTSRALDVALTRLRIGHTALTAHLHRLNLAPDPYCPWCRDVEETIEHLILVCPRFYSHRVLLRSQLQALGVPSFDLPTLLAAEGVQPQRQPTVLRLMCAFLKKTGQLPRL